LANLPWRNAGNLILCFIHHLSAGKQALASKPAGRFFSPFQLRFMKTFKSLMGRLANTEPAGIINPTSNNMQTTGQAIDLQAGYISYHRKFELVSGFVNSIYDVLAISDRYYNGAPYVCYHSIKHILKNAFNEYPSPGINYRKVSVCRGLLWNTQRAMAKSVVGTLTFSWINDAGIGGANSDDQCILVAYSPTLNKCAFSKEGGERQAGKAELAVPEFHGQKVHTWIGFISADESRISNSIYTGEVLVA
jgi:hypothetical protein